MELVHKAIQGDAAAFTELIAPYRPRLSNWLAYVLGDDGEDCLQEALLSAWLGLPQLKQAGQFKAWLYRIARNRCLDYLRRQRKAQQVEIPLEDEPAYLVRLPMGETDSPSLADLVGQLSQSERQVIWSYYVDRVPVQQISREKQVSEGTIKRLLFNGRSRLRLVLNRDKDGEKTMSKTQRFLLPDERPEIAIEPAQVEPFTVILQEQPWFFVPLAAGGKAQWCMFDPPDWRRTDTCQIKVSGRAQVHGLDCLEITEEWDESIDGKITKNKWKCYTRQTDDFTQTLAVIAETRGILKVDSFLDESFVERWGEKSARIWKDEERFTIQGNRLESVDSHKSGGAGYFKVRIGQKPFTCLRVFDTCDVKGDAGVMVEAYLSAEGRTVLFRRYNSLGWRRSPDWYPQAQANQRLFLDGVEYVHWYDCLSDYVF